ncbi:cyclopropane-fatty-acyl-phospholipid synthase family protein [Geobacter sp. DSM 9736]|uniref:SAM-dependent methyltransferase n=1 Tax=Geobacter sp. DSM 9736 TaxID=1277350 RepID=UPI000B509EDA|nr:cyclopropane-fatty-acyl-phospholipid synthase family protein [Geobacter sp. DSM 9736]SNB45214.1 cyclopropane-fatty-acyl-phospholipid synthase [Geobacter sp. DSM 9736]
MKENRAPIDRHCPAAEADIGDRGTAHQLEKWLLGKFLDAMGTPPLRVTLWDGQVVETASDAPVGMVIHERISLWKLIINPLLYFGEEYSAGRIDVQGPLASFIETVYRAGAPRRYPLASKPDAHRRRQSRTNTLSGSRDNIHQHYDIGNDFYCLWLDWNMVYTCAYFPHPATSLEEAQIAKMDLVCRKLRLNPGQTVVEAGCGWGSLARHMARRYGVKVRAFNISGEQVAYARERAASDGLSGQVEYIEEDYRNITGSYDAFVSVGMLEHVGPDHYRELGEVIRRTLKPEGTGLIHTIGQNVAEPMGPWLLKYIFPGGYPPTLREMMEVFEPWGFSVLDVENLRLHYARTLEHWLERFEQNAERIRRRFDDRFVRMWRLYLSGSIANFNVGNLQLFQVLFARATNNFVPWTRSHLALTGGET